MPTHVEISIEHGIRELFLNQWRNVKSGINQDTLQNAMQSKVILPVFSLKDLLFVFCFFVGRCHMDIDSKYQYMYFPPLCM